MKIISTLIGSVQIRRLRVTRILVSWILLSMAAVTSAHHSNTPFDMSRTLHAGGIVQKANFKNPHSLLTLLIDVDGETRAVTFEGHSLATLRHYGLRPAMVREGERVAISYAPRRDGQPGGIFLAVTTASGETLDFSHLGYE